MIIRQSKNRTLTHFTPYHTCLLGAADKHRLLPDGFGSSYPLDAVQGISKLNQLVKGCRENLRPSFIVATKFV